METLLTTPQSPKDKLHSYGSDEIDICDNNNIQKGQFKTVWKNKSYRRICLFQTLYLTQMVAVSPFIVLYGAQWFSNCLSTNGRDVEDNCDPDYATYNFYMTMFVSIEALLSFLASGFMGKLSDSFGRKIFLIITILSYMIPRTTMIFYVNFWLYFCLALGQALYTGLITIIVKGYVADIFIDKNIRITAYAGIHSSSALGAILAVGLAMTVTTIWNNHTMFIALSFLYIIFISYTLIFVEESLLPGNRNKFEMKQLKSYNPTRPLFKIFQHKFMIYMALISFVFQTVESGVIASLFAYVGDTFNLTEDGEATLIFGGIQLLMGTLVIPASLILLPCLQKRCKETNIVIISCMFRVLAILAFAAISYEEIDIFYQNYFVLFTGAICYGLSFFGGVVLDSLLTKFVHKNSQGIAFGIINSYKDIARIFAPFSFGAFYVYTLNNFNMPYIYLLLALFLQFILILIIIFGLKPIIENDNVSDKEGMEFKTIGSEPQITPETQKQKQHSIVLLSELTDNSNIEDRAYAQSLIIFGVDRGDHKFTI
eukprot:532607_1